jgi:hypothetical protein
MKRRAPVTEREFRSLLDSLLTWGMWMGAKPGEPAPEENARAVHKALLAMFRRLKREAAAARRMAK